MPETAALILGLCALATFLTLVVLPDRFAADEAEHPTHDSAGNVR